MEIYDSHTHFSEDPGEVAAVIARARTAGVTRMMAVGSSFESNNGARLAHRTDPGAVRLALGYHPDFLTEDGTAEEVRTLARLRADLASLPCAAVGEMGLDFHYNPETAKAQCDLFARQLALAEEAGLPVVIHTREADDATRGVIDDIPHRGAGLRGVIHCFTGSPAFAREMLDRHFAVSISGIVTFKAAENVRKAARAIPDDRLLVETDAPWLAPVPLRGKPNEPAYITHTVRFLAAVRGTTPERLAALTFANAAALFG